MTDPTFPINARLSIGVVSGPDASSTMMRVQFQTEDGTMVRAFVPAEAFALALAGRSEQPCSVRLIETGQRLGPVAG